MKDNKSLHPIWPPVKAFARCSRGEANALPGVQTGELNRYGHIRNMKCIASLIFILIGCTADRNIICRIQEPALPSIYTRTDGEIFPICDRLCATIETLPENKCAAYITMRDKRNNIVFTTPVYGGNIEIEWLSITSLWPLSKF